MKEALHSNFIPTPFGGIRLGRKDDDDSGADADVAWYGTRRVARQWIDQIV